MLFDNVVGPLDSPSLAALLTSSTFTDRVLGRSEERQVPNMASIAITGNNPTLSTELQRRVSLCRIDAKVAKPDLREDFRHADLEAWVIDNRGRLIWALCTLTQHWLAEGQPNPTSKSLQSYVSWSRVVGGIIEAAGWHGFQSNRDQIGAVAGADEEEPIERLIREWWDEGVKSDGKLGLKDQFVAGEKGLAAFCDAMDLSLPVKRRMGDMGAVYEPNALGTYLRSFNGRVFEIDDTGACVELVTGEKRKNGKPWSLVLKRET